MDFMPATGATPQPDTPVQADSVAGFLRLAAAQLRAALTDALPDLESLTREVLILAGENDALRSSGLREHPPPDSGAYERALGHLQITDRLQQRLGNTEQSLIQLARLLDRTGPVPVPADWRTFLAEARAICTMDDERCAFDAATADSTRSPVS